MRFDENGHKVYIVTFRDTDPFWIFDLQPNQKPKILADLKIPGYSSYLHPFDDTTLIGLGRNAVNETVDVQILGLKVILVDISNKTKPKTLAEHI